MNDDIRALYETEHTYGFEKSPGSVESKSKEREYWERRKEAILEILPEQMEKVRKKQKKLEKKVKALTAPETEVRKEAKTTVPVEKSFWRRLGDVVIKAVPVILTTIATSVCNFLFKRAWRNGGYRQGWA